MAAPDVRHDLKGDEQLRKAITDVFTKANIDARKRGRRYARYLDEARVYFDSLLHATA